MANLDRRKLADYIVRRRNELGMRDRRALERRTRELGIKVSDRTIGKVELEEPVSASTLASLEIALDWEPGSARDILEGGEPRIKGEPRRAAPRAPDYDDPVEQGAWDALRDVPLPEHIRRGMIRYARAARDEGDRRDDDRRANAG
jgi:hypothetical protein